MTRKFTDAFLGREPHPLGPRQMRRLVAALVSDNFVREAREITLEMINWSRPGTVEDHHFYYWLGVDDALQAYGERELELARIASDKKFARALSKARGAARYGARLSARAKAGGV